MGDIYDSIDPHVIAAGDMERACTPLGMLMAWCANLRLLSSAVEQEQEQLLLRVRVQEASGADLLVACGGELRRTDLNKRGQNFMDQYFPNFLSDYAQALGSDIYAAENSWSNYSELAVVLTRRLMTAEGHRSASQQGEKNGWVQRLVRSWRSG